MRFLFKRPNAENVKQDLDTVINVMLSDIYIYFDLLWYSLIFTLFLIPVLHSLKAAILFFGGSYVFFCCLFFFFISSIKRRGWKRNFSIKREGSDFRQPPLLD